MQSLLNSMSKPKAQTFPPREMEISPPIHFADVKIKPLPLTIRDKDLPVTPPSLTPPPIDISALEEENEKLRAEIRSLQSQLARCSHQMNRYRQVAIAAKAFSKEASTGVRHFQNAAFKFKTVEKEAGKEWADFQGSMEDVETFI